MRIRKRWLGGLNNCKGSSTVEYVIVLALGLILAGILYQTLSSDTVACKMKQAIGRALELEMAEDCGKEVAEEAEGEAKQAQPPSEPLLTTTPTTNPSTNPSTPEPNKDSGFWSSLGDFLAKGWENTKEGASDLWNETKEVASAAWEGMKDGASAAWEWSKEDWEYLAAGGVALSGIALCFLAPPLGIAVLASGGISGGISALMGNDMDTIMADAALGGVAGLVGLGGFAAGTAVARPLLGQAGRAVAPWVRRMLPKAAGLFTGGFAETSTFDWLKSGKFDWKKSAALGALSVALGGTVALTPQIPQGMNNLGKQLGMSTSTSADGTLAMPLFNKAEDQVRKAVGSGEKSTKAVVLEGANVNTAQGYTTKVSGRTKVLTDYPEFYSRSRVLRAELKSAGIKPPPYPNAAHHIVAWKEPQAARARKILDKFGIEYDSAVNGVFLPYKNSTYVGNETLHVGSHGKNYYDTVNERLRKIKAVGGTREDIVKEINQIRKELLNGSLKLN